MCGTGALGAPVLAVGILPNIDGFRLSDLQPAAERPVLARVIGSLNRVIQACE